MVVDGTIKRFNSAQKLGQDGTILQEVTISVTAKLTEAQVAQLARLQKDGLVKLTIDKTQMGFMGMRASEEPESAAG